MSDEWKDLKAEAMTHEQAVEAVKELRKLMAENTEKPVFIKKPPLGCKPAYISNETGRGYMQRATYQDERKTPIFSNGDISDKSQ